jgi:hypothetical protein
LDNLRALWARLGFALTGIARPARLLSGRLIPAPGCLTLGVDSQTVTRVLQSRIVRVPRDVPVQAFQSSLHRLARRIGIRERGGRTHHHYHADYADKFVLHETLSGFPALSHQY